MAGFRSPFRLSLLSAALIASPFLWPVLFPLTWLAPVPFLTAVEGARDWRRALFAGALTGAVTIALGFHWLVYTIHVFGGVNYAVAVAGFVIFVAYSAIPFVAFAGLVRLCGIGPLGLYPPAFWVAVEFWFPNLFPWYLATSQTLFTSLNQSADLVGHYGATFVVLWCGTALYQVLGAWQGKARRDEPAALPRNRTPGARGDEAEIRRFSFTRVLRTLGMRGDDAGRRRAAWSAAAALAMLAASLVYGQARLAQVDAAARAAAKLDVAVVQGNISIERKGKAAHLRTNQRTYRELSARSAGADLIIWPESAVERWLPDSARRFPRELLPARHPHMIVGAITYRRLPGSRYRKYNSAIAVSPGGAVVGRYHKRVLLAFGEYIPLAWLIGELPGMATIGDGFTPGGIDSAIALPPDVRGALGRGESGARNLPPGARVGPLICYEDLMPALSRRFVRDERANLLVNLTNDAWYGRTVAPWQHARLARWRAIETRRAMVRATNTGVTTVIGPAGRMSPPLPLFTEGVLEAEVPLMEMETVYVRYGDWFAWLMTLVTAAAVAVRGFAVVLRPSTSLR